SRNRRRTVRARTRRSDGSGRRCTRPTTTCSRQPHKLVPPGRACFVLPPRLDPGDVGQDDLTACSACFLLDPAVLLDHARVPEPAPIEPEAVAPHVIGVHTCD